MKKRFPGKPLVRTSSIIESMKPEHKNGNALVIKYCVAESPFGLLFIASSQKGIVSMSFTHTRIALRELTGRFPHARCVEKNDVRHAAALSLFKKGTHRAVRIHLKGTPFQLRVWRALLQIPSGHLSTYGEIARRIRHPKAYRAVGTAVGQNPVAFLIPCHRVIQSRGPLGKYRWGSKRKQAMISWESAR